MEEDVLEGVVEGEEGPEKEPTRRVSVFWGSLGIGVGLVLIAIPLQSLSLVALIFSFFLVLTGSAQVLKFLKGGVLPGKFSLLKGLFTLLIGILGVSSPYTMASLGVAVPVIALGICLITLGGLDLLLTNFHLQSTYLRLSALGKLGVGVFLCFAPLASALLVFRFLGFLVFVFSGLVLFIGLREKP